MIKTIDEIRNALDANIPRDVISERVGGGGKKLSYLEGWYVKDRLNQIVKQGNWSYRTEELRLVVEDKESSPFAVSYVAKVTLEIRGFTTNSDDQVPHRYTQVGYTEFSDYGYGEGKDYKNIGAAHEKAVKEAVTDAFKRCAMNLGRSMGLALYDKEQTYVDDNATQSSARVFGGETASTEPGDNSDTFRNVATSTAAVDSNKVRLTKVVNKLVKSNVLTGVKFKERYLAPRRANFIRDLNEEDVGAVLTTITEDFADILTNYN